MRAYYHTCFTLLLAGLALSSPAWVKVALLSVTLTGGVVI